MLVCWEWLAQYVDLSVDAGTMADKFAMSGLNHESTTQVGVDTVIDLEVTSNRGDCLGHIGIAREAAVLLGNPLRMPKPEPAVGKAEVGSFLSLENRFAEACPRYTARVIRGVRVGPSPNWLVRRLAAIGIKSVNNVVDVTNYVMMECGQPLHAFDLAQIKNARIIVRPAAAGEKFLAIDHRTYELDPKVLVIADGERPVALGGVMGGAESEVSESTQDVVIEAAAFAPLSIRRTARKLKLHSPSSFRFERRPDPAGLEWASLRCCELILQVAGGSLCAGVVVSGEQSVACEAIGLRLGQIERILGISVPYVETVQILTDLGCKLDSTADASDPINSELQVTPPTWRADLTREIDLIEEVARIHGYDKIPEDVMVPLAVAPPRPKDIALERARHVLSAYGIDEAMTPSVVTELLENCGSVWTSLDPLSTETPLLVGSRLLRRSLIPSLLAARYTNQSQAIRNAQLYEVANIYLPSEPVEALPREQSSLGILTAGDLQFVKGIVESILEEVAGKSHDFSWTIEDHPCFEAGSSQRIKSRGALVGWLGMVSRDSRQRLSLEHPCAAAELNIDLLTSLLNEVRRADPISPFPAIARDLNFVVDETLTWGQLSAAIKDSGGPDLQSVDYQETYRDSKKDGPGKKRILLSVHFQSLTRTLTGDEVDSHVRSIVSAAQHKFSAQLLG